jgi:hypothetical protein
MNNIDTYNQLVEVMINEDDESLEEFMILESDGDEVISNLDGDSTLFNYIMLFEEFLEQHDIYLFKGWDTASIFGSPVVEKFWVTIRVLVDDNTDMRGASRINNAMEQGGVVIKKTSDGQRVVEFSILKRDLDQIEKTNKTRIEKLSVAALNEL